MVRSRLLAGDDGILLGLVMAEAGNRKVRMVEALGSRSVSDDTWAGSRESCAAAVAEAGACSPVQVLCLPSAAAVAPLEPSAAALTDRPTASESVLAAEHDVRSSPTEEGTS